MTTDIRYDVLGRLKTALAAIDDATLDIHQEIEHMGFGVVALAPESRLNAATAEARLQVARLERAIEAAELEEESR
jgi:hypothetical protein